MEGEKRRGKRGKTKNAPPMTEMGSICGTRYKNKWAKWAHLSHGSGGLGQSGKFGILPKTPAQHSAKNLPAFLAKIIERTKKAAASARKTG